MRGFAVRDGEVEDLGLAPLAAKHVLEERHRALCAVCAVPLQLALA